MQQGIVGRKTSEPGDLALMQPQQSKNNASANGLSEKAQSERLQVPALPEPTFGQKLADKMAAKVGSWAFLIGQTTVLTAWVGCNLAPGMPHWDESPFILLNLVFSFASAYTAPVVLMSQNRQSDEDRAQSMQNHQINLQTAQNLELLQQKLDDVYSQKLTELTELIRQQQASAPAVAPTPLPNYVGFLPNTVKPFVLPTVDEPLFAFMTKPEQAEEMAAK
jgi:uncharacterized membrane protein